MKKRKKRLHRFPWEAVLVIFMVIIGGIAHAWNMFHFPYYENDEGVYMSQAWSLINLGKLAPYTYWYDHAPFGWVVIALWTLLTGGFFTFGFSINSGRVLMLLLHVISSVLIYFIMKRLTARIYPGLLAIAIFSFSPLGIYFQRRVLLDNLMTVWLLASLACILFYRKRLRLVVISAILFSFSILSKEVALFFIPCFLYILWKETDVRHRLFAAALWISTTGIVVSLYFIYALIKGEFFPSGTLLGGSHPHVSLLSALAFQAGRGGGSIFDFQTSSFWSNMRIWIDEDKALIYTGIIASVLTTTLALRSYKARVISLLVLSFWFFLMRGGLVIEFYIIPMIPLLAMAIGMSFYFIYEGMSRLLTFSGGRVIAGSLQFLLVLGLIAAFLMESRTVRGSYNIYTSDQTTPQKEAVNWILQQESPSTMYVIDNYAYIDLRVKNKSSVKTEWYWKVDRDPEISQNLLNKNPENIDFIALTPQMERDLRTQGLILTSTAWSKATPINRFWKDGWGVEIWANKTPNRILSSSWTSYKKRFIHNGQVIDPSGNTTTSEGQSYALLRAVWMGDRTTFDNVWEWTSKNMQLSSNLFGWRLQKGMLEEGTASDADEDIALALIFASKRWEDDHYLSEAKNIISAIWENEVVIRNNTPILVAGNWAAKRPDSIINPSYLAPVNYRIFQDVDIHHDWTGVIDSSYQLLQDCTSTVSTEGEEGSLPPDWCMLTESGDVTPSNESGMTSTNFGYDAMRTMWRISLDYLWYKDKRALSYLENNQALRTIWESEHKLPATLTHSGRTNDTYESVATYGSTIGYFLVTNKDEAAKIFQEKIAKKFYENAQESYWDDPRNYYSQNWAWFGTALYTSTISNLWDSKKSYLTKR